MKIPNETVEYRKLHSKNLHALYSSRTADGIIKQSIMKCAEHLTCMIKGESDKLKRF
jgi:hypothetical protein